VSLSPWCSALDVVVRRVSQTMLKVKLGVSIDYDRSTCGAMAQMVDRIAVMYAGKLSKLPRWGMFNDAKHPYSQLLIESVPSLKNVSHQNLPRRHYARSRVTHRQFASSNCAVICDGCAAARDAPPCTEVKAGSAVACHLSTKPTKMGASSMSEMLLEIRNATKGL